MQTTDAYGNTVDWLTNGQIEVGVVLNKGAIIGYIREPGGMNVISEPPDIGGSVQAAFTGQASGEFYWNPTQGGNKDGTASEVVEHTNNGVQMYSRIIPRDWDEFGEYGGGPVDGVLEQWVTLVGKTAHVRWKFTNGSGDHAGGAQYNMYQDPTVPSWPQQNPCCGFQWGMSRFMAYTGVSPWTGGATTYYNGPGDPTLATAFPPIQYGAVLPPIREKWFARMLPSTDWGVGVFTPQLNDTPHVNGISGPPTAFAYVGGGGVIIGAFHDFSPGSVLDWDTYFTLGTAAEIKAKVYDIHANGFTDPVPSGTWKINRIKGAHVHGGVVKTR